MNILYCITFENNDCPYFKTLLDTLKALQTKSCTDRAWHEHCLTPCTVYGFLPFFSARKMTRVKALRGYGLDQRGYNRQAIE